MSNSPFRSKQVPGPVRSEFAARKDGSKLLQWTAKRFPWIHVLSCASGCDSNYSPLSSGKSLSLFGAASSKAGYSTTTKLPLPVVVGVDVTAMGSLGTTRKAVVKLTCFSDEQLVELQKCYFIPGMDVRVQWGWSVSCDGSTPPPPLTNSSAKTHDAVCAINKRRKQYNNYDGFQGIVANFKYKLNKDNAWDCEIEIISAADPFTESNVSNSTCPCPRKVETDQGEAVKDFGPVYAALSDIYNEGKKAVTRIKGALSKNTKDTKYHVFTGYNYEGVERTETGGERDGSWWDGIFAGEETVEYWMSFGAFVDLLNMMSIPNKGGGEYPLGKIDINDVLLNAPKKYIMSADPRVCYIPGGSLEPKLYTNSNILGTTAPSAIVDDKVQLASIMCNTIFLLKHYKQTVDGDGKLKTLLDNVLQEINRVCGKPWTFVTISTEEECDATSRTGPTITILDEKQTMKTEAPYLVPSKVGESTLRDFSLEMKLTGAMKTQALYAGNSPNSIGASGDDSTACAGAASRPFYVGSGKNLAKPEPKSLKADCGDCESSDNKAEEPTFQDLVDKFWWEVNDQAVGAMQTFLDNELSEYNPKQCAGTPLPFDLGFTVDGVSGFEFGQMISSDRIPEGIRKSFRWQVTKVEHSVTVNDWTTTISTVCRSNPFGDQADGGQAKR
jgi:hypothetical protein